MMIIDYLKRNQSKLVIWLIFIWFIILNFGHHRWVYENKVIEWDIKSYYAYLPATFIYHDLELDFRKNDMKKFGDLIWPVPTPIGKQCIVTSMGMSILYSPFFFIGHMVAKFTDYDADGYSEPYRFVLVFSSLFYLLLGLFFLRKILLYFFPQYIATIVIIAIAIGTNLLFYSTYSAAMPHCYNFSLITIFIFLTVQWYKFPNIKNTIFIGLLSGLIVLVRPTNIIVLVFFMFYNVKSIKELGERISFLLHKYRLILLMAIMFIVVWVPQFMYWKYISGKIFFFSYGPVGGKFFFNNPQVMDTLFSYRKGWLIYTPIMILSLLGIVFLHLKEKRFFTPVLIYTILNIYVISSWWCWWYGGSFGLRAFVDSYGIMALPLATIINISLNKKYLRYFVIGIVAVLIWFNVFQVGQYNRQAIHYWWMNKEAYWETFLRKRPTARYWELVTIPDYERARQGKYIPVLPYKKNLIIDEDSIKQSIKFKYIQDSVIMDSLKYISRLERFNLDSLINKTVDDKFYQNKDAYRKSEIINTLRTKILENPDLVRAYKKEAKLLSIPFNSVITREAIKSYHNYNYK